MTIQSRIVRGIGFGALAAASLGYIVDVPIVDTAITSSAHGYRSPGIAPIHRKAQSITWLDLGSQYDYPFELPEGVTGGQPKSAPTYLSALLSNPTRALDDHSTTARVLEHKARVDRAIKAHDAAKSIADAHIKKAADKKATLAFEEELAIVMLMAA